MWIEAVERPLTYRWPGGEIRLEPGHPVDVPDDRAQRLIAKTGDKVRSVPRPVYWESGGQILGPHHRTGTGWWSDRGERRGLRERL